MFGGISTHVTNLGRELRNLGIDVDIFVGKTDTKSLMLPAACAFDDYDLVHVQSSPYGAFVRGSKLVVTVHAPVLVEMSHYNLFSLSKSPLAFLMEKLAFRKAGAILSVSETTASDLAAKYRIKRNRITVIGNGVDYQRFLARGEVTRNPKRVLLVSRLEPRKNVEEPLRALATLAHDNYEVQIVGLGSQNDRLRALANSLRVNASFMGSVDHDALPSVYQGASLFVTSSRSEGFGLSLLEALSAGCAVVASDIQPHRELVTHGFNGLLYGNPSELRNQLVELLADPTEARRLGSAGMARAREFSWESVARRVLRAYQGCLAQ